ncbi:hypothetical protein [Vibrio alfacsensis]|uniref:hypothetical protein n=1 Tax=Vibrio alfacsensis TaxID=1074311 RepID=UPI001C7F3CD9|nr:hypothetical protein [Vibrio alfacsensis]
MEAIFILFLFGAIPALASICYLLPSANWSTKFKVLASRGLLKFPFGVLFGFLGVFLLELFRVGLNQQMFHWLILVLSVYAFAVWLYLYLYKFILNRFFLQNVSWTSIIKSIMVEIGILALLVTSGFIISAIMHVYPSLP